MVKNMKIHFVLCSLAENPATLSVCLQAHENMIQHTGALPCIRVTCPFGLTLKRLFRSGWVRGADSAIYESDKCCGTCR